MNLWVAVAAFVIASGASPPQTDHEEEQRHRQALEHYQKGQDAMSSERPEQAIQATVVQGFKVGAGKERSAAADGGPGFWEIFHGEKLVLVDRQMRIRGYFDATPEGIDKLMEAVGRVASGA